MGARGGGGRFGRQNRTEGVGGTRGAEGKLEAGWGGGGVGRQNGSEGARGARGVDGELETGGGGGGGGKGITLAIIGSLTFI